ncbi:MAG TPA: NAD(P)-dependent oxidoreductase [Solirubrobacteraceae bacterium]|nr:NAD(P)-dependent oxidoreductase [Solirubrobacteraceae bacterium]
MKVFVAGATGAIGRPLVRMLVADGHEVVGMTRTAAKAHALREVGAEPVVCDALDARTVADAIARAQPQALIHQLTAIPARLDPRRIVRDFALTDRLRTEGTRILLDAARAAGVQRILAQSIAFIYEPGPPGTVHVESDRLHTRPPKQFARTVSAAIELERQVREAGGQVLRYGYFYGPGSSISRTGAIGTDVARRRLPVVGGGTGVWSLIHVDDAACATVAALAREATGAYNIVDDAPAPVAEWVPGLAAALGAPRPLRVPAWLARPLAGSYGVMTMTRAQGASNSLAKRELGWQPRYPSWREGFARGLG